MLMGVKATINRVAMIPNPNPLMNVIFPPTPILYFLNPDVYSNIRGMMIRSETKG
jgi:hypothetical protein